MEDTFTIQQIKTYILSQDSLGDVLYNLKDIKKIIAEIELHKRLDDNRANPNRHWAQG